MKKIIRLTESDLHKIVKESVEKILKEGVPDPSDYLWGGPDPSDYLWDEPGNRDFEHNDEEDDEPFDFDEKYYGDR